MTVLVCAPHPDDEMIGMGGTIAKFAADGEDVIVVIFTLGEGSHPWQRKEAINLTRQEEALQAGKIAGTKETVFLKLKDLSISNEIVEKDVDKELLALIKRHKPRAIFTPALDDVHNDHQAVAKLVKALKEEHSIDIPIWMYTVWNPFFVKNRDQPRLVVDITKHFQTKWRAIQVYRSQKISTVQLIPTVMIRGFLHGLQHGHTIAEVFLKSP